MTVPAALIGPTALRLAAAGAVTGVWAAVLWLSVLNPDLTRLHTQVKLGLVLGFLAHQGH